MPNTGDSFTVSLMPSQVAWGIYRNPTNRALIQGEGYQEIVQLPIIFITQ